MTKKDEFIIKQVSCNNCLGTGFTESTTEKNIARHAMKMKDVINVKIYLD